MQDNPDEHNAIRLGAVSFLNSRPLIEGLDAERGVHLHLAVPSRLGGLLRCGEVDAALVPVVEFARAGAAWRIVSDACIAADGETLTVRVFSRVAPGEVGCIHVDGDSLTSVVLAQLVWSRAFGRPVITRPLASAADTAACEAVLLIGDKVVSFDAASFPHVVDLGGAWKEWTGLPFVFAVWAGPVGRDWQRIARELSEARNRGVRDALRIAREQGPALGWPVPLAEAYLTRHMQYRLTDAARLGMERFLADAQDEGLLPRSANVVTR